MTTTYQLIDSRTGKLMGTYQDRIRARRRADKLDNEYGAVRYIVKPVWADEIEEYEDEDGRIRTRQVVRG